MIEFIYKLKINNKLNMVCLANWCDWPQTNEDFYNINPHIIENTDTDTNNKVIAKTFDNNNREGYLWKIREVFEKYVPWINILLNWENISAWQWVYVEDKLWNTYIYTAKHNLLFEDKGKLYYPSKNMLRIDWHYVLQINIFNDKDLAIIKLKKKEKKSLDISNEINTWETFFSPWMNWNFELKFTWYYEQIGIWDWINKEYNMAVFNLIWNWVDKIKWWDSWTPLIWKDWKTIWIISAVHPFYNNKVYVTLF